MRRLPLAAALSAMALAGVLATAAALSGLQQSEPSNTAYAPLLAADSAVPVTPTPTASPTTMPTSTPTPSPGTSTPTAPATSTPTSTSTPVEFREITVSQGEIEVALTVELAVTPAQRAKGLMFRTELGDDEGMLFVFGGPSGGGFWMKNTLIPLDIAYLDSSGEVMEIRHGVPLDTTPLVPEDPYWYVLEVPGGWFDRMGMGVGAQVSIPDDLP